MNQIYVRTEYGIDFLNGCGDLVQEMVFQTPEERLEVYNAVSTDDNNPHWPETAVEYNPWERHIYRAPVYGVDYGPGSIKRRFGGRVPCGAYQFR